MSNTAISDLPFSEAAKLWLSSRDTYISPSSIRCYRYYLDAIDKFFGDHTLSEIHIGHIQAYQRERRTNALGRWTRKAGSSCINHEINTVSQVLDFAGLWQPIAKHYKPVPTPRWTPPRVLTSEEEERLFRIAACNLDYELAYLAASITNNTSASGCELRNLQLKHLFLREEMPEIHIPSNAVKNEFRARRIPLNDTARKQFQRVLERAYRLGSHDPDHYLFPFRVKRNSYDPTRPASRYWIRAQFEALRKAAGIPWLRPHDLRHQAITRLLEASVPEHTVMSIAGHVSRQMIDHYSHIRMNRKMDAVRAIEPRHFEAKPVQSARMSSRKMA